MTQQIPLSDEVGIDAASIGEVVELADDVAYQRLAIVNVIYWGTPNSDHWVLIDAGVGGSAAAIRRAVAARFGEHTRPAAIVMTHGHFDHVGALRTLAEHWDVPIYAHPLETPFLNGQSSYPPPDPSVGGGLMATLARFYPRGPVDVSSWLRPLPADGSIPEMPHWQWVYTPGHTQGHISLWRPSDRFLIAGDAVITTAQESAYAVLRQEPELHGPPMYFTPDWEQAEQSVRQLAALQPERVVTGHGPALHGPAMRAALERLANNFRTVAVPKQD